MRGVWEGEGGGSARRELTLCLRERFASRWLCQVDPAFAGPASLCHPGPTTSPGQHVAPALSASSPLPKPRRSYLSRRKDLTKASSGSGGTFVCVGAGRTLWCSSVGSEAGRRVLTPWPGHSWGCWDLLCAGFSFLVLASCKHLNGECDGPSILIPVQTQLSFPGLSSRSQETTKALGAELPLLPLGAEYPKKSLTPQIPLWGQGGGEFHIEPLRHSWANAQNLPC